MKTTHTLSALLATVALVAAGCGGSSNSTGSSTTGTTMTNTGAASPVLPVQTNPIQNTSTAPGLRIVSVLVENNVDPATKKATDDHLEIKLENTGPKALTGLEVYYELTDPSTGAHEGYYRKLDGLAIAPGATQTVHFDSKSGPGHYPDNKYSLYNTSKNALQVKVTVSAAGVAVQTKNLKKDAGGAENPGE
jgi:hypothetical protein